jgi:hypothetical protein
VRPADRPLGTWIFDAHLRGIFLERETAQAVAGMAMTALPAGKDDIPFVSRLDWASMPLLDRSVIDLSSDQHVGGEVRVWVLEFPLWVVFHNTTYGA